MKDKINLKFTVSSDSKASDALLKIEENKSGVVFVVNKNLKVIGSITDGDIRRKLIEGFETGASILEFMNKDFVFASENTPRLEVLKIFDSKIKSVPVLSNDGELLEVVFSKNFPIKNKSKVTYHSQSPTRIGLAGGGGDVTYFFVNKRGIAINLAIQKFARATLKVREDQALKVTAHSLGINKFFQNKDSLFKDAGELGLLAETIRLVNPDYGFELDVFSDVPIGSGLGGSSSITMAILGVFNQAQASHWGKSEMVELAYQAERHYLGVDGGWQDQYAAAYGGFNYIEFKRENNRIFPLRLESSIHYGLEEMLVLVDTGIYHDSGDLHKKQKENFKKNKIIKQSMIELNIKHGEKFFDFIMEGELNQAAKVLNQMWENKRKLSDSISNPKINEIYCEAIKAGALGGKLLGAGGGGHFCFFVPLEVRADFISTIEDLGLKAFAVSIDNEGLVCWTRS